MGDVIQLDDHRRIWTVGFATCRRCTVRHVSVHPITADPNRLECPCGASDNDYEPILGDE